MATPASFTNPAREAQDLQDEKAKESYQQGHDADKIPVETFTKDVEKGAQSQAHSTHTDERTLSNEAITDQPEAPQDPHVVDWDGPDDPKNPQNWAASRKWGIIAALAAVTLITPLASSFFAPGVPQVLRTFEETSKTMATFVVSIYILGFAIGPLIIAPMSEMYGRNLLYSISNLLFVIFNVACALSTSLDMLIVFRFFAGCAGSAPLTLGGGTIADMFPPEQRAGAMAIWSLGPGE